MSTGSAIGQVREGMQVVTSDGTSLGRVEHVHSGTVPTDPLQQCEDESCVEVRRTSLGRELVQYVPCRAISGVLGNTVRLNLDMETASAEGWGRRPAWLGSEAQETKATAPTRGHGGGGIDRPADARVAGRGAVVDIARIHKGMEVHASDGVCLGKVRELWLGTDPASTHARCDEEVCSRLEVHHRERLIKDVVMYIPYSAIVDVSGNNVVLDVDSETANSKGWSYKPHWIDMEGTPPITPVRF